MIGEDLCEVKFCQRALKILSENLEMINICEPMNVCSLYGDVITWKLPRKEFIIVPLEDSFLCSFIVPDSEMGQKLSKFSEWYIKPAIDDLAQGIKESNKGSIKFCQMPNSPPGLGAKSFVGSYENLKLRCTLQYDSNECGTKVCFHVLFATVDLTDCDIHKPKTPAITLIKEGR